MYELQVSVSKVLGTCTAEPPMKVGNSFTVRDGDIRIPAGGYVCLWALQSLLPLITPKEREIAEDRDQDWMWRVHHAQCPDPGGRVIWKIERVAKVSKGVGISPPSRDAAPRSVSIATNDHSESEEGGLQSLRVVVEEVRGRCTSGLQPGDHFTLHSGRLYIPAERHFCLYALHAVLPMLPAKQRPLAAGDWMRDAQHAICPDPAGNVVMRIEPL